MKKFFTFLLCVLFVSALSAQTYTAAVQEADPDNVPVIGGDLDAAWEQAVPHSITLPYQSATRTETPSLGEEGDTYWKALFTDEGIYILVYVADDVYSPYYARSNPDSTGNLHEFDCVEVFLDCNLIKQDGVGGHSTSPFNGHYQLAPGHVDGIASEEGWDDGTLYENEAIGYTYARNAVAHETHYFEEFFLPWSNIKDKDGEQANLAEGVGFEVAIADDDTGDYGGRNRLVWSWDGNGSDQDSYQNMDNCGLMTFEGYEVVEVADIILSGSDITENGDSLVIDVEFISENPPQLPTNTTIHWHISGASTAKYLFDEKTRTLVPLSDGTFIVYVTDASGWVESNELVINISNQKPTINKLSYIVDGFNDNPQDDGRPNAAWEKDSDGYGEHSVWVDGGILQMSSDSMLADPWSLKVRQQIDKDRLLANQEKEFVAKWKMWAEEDTSFQLVLEQLVGWGSYPHWGNNSATLTPDVVTPVEGQTRWNIKATTEPTWYQVSFTPDNLDPEASKCDFGFQIGHTGGVIIFMDSLYLIEAADEDIIDWGTSVKNTKLSESTLKVYPNPASNVLNVSLSGTEAKTKVAIFNSVGTKMDEIEVFGNHHVFDVSNYSSGIYIVKANDKFVKFVR